MTKNETLKEKIIEKEFYKEFLKADGKFLGDKCPAEIAKWWLSKLSQKDLELKEMIEGMKANTRFMSKTDIRSIEETKGYNQFADDLLAKLTKE